MTQHVPIEQRGMGRIVDVPDPRDYTLRQLRRTPRSTPRSVNLLDRLGPVLNQLRTPECVTHAAAALKCFYERKQHRHTYAFDPHRAYRECKQRDGIPHEDGTYTRTVLDLMLHVGYGRDGEPWETDAPRYTIGSYARLRTIGEIEEAVAHGGPVLVGLMWLDTWTEQVTLLSTPPRIAEAGGHELVIAGYDRSVGFMWLRNSWGSGYGLGGNCQITYNELERQLSLPDDQSADVWAVVDA